MIVFKRSAQNIHFKNVENINVDSDSITPQKKLNGREKYCQGNHKIPFGKNEANKSIIEGKTIGLNSSKTIELNASKTIEPTNASNKIEQIASKKK